MQEMVDKEEHCHLLYLLTYLLTIFVKRLLVTEKLE